MEKVRLEELKMEVKTKKKLPRFKAGQTVRVFQKIKEGEKERVQMFQGLIIEVKNPSSVYSMITVRKIVDGIGVEKVFPVYSPFIEKIEFVKEAKVRHSRIFFMRGRSGKSARLQERFYSEAELKAMMPHEVTEEEVEEAIHHEEEQKKKEEEEAAKKSVDSAQEDTSPENQISPDKE